MNSIEKRDYIHNHLGTLNDKVIDDMFKKIKTIVENTILLTVSQEKEIEERVIRHKSGESKSYSWTEVKKRAKTKI